MYRWVDHTAELELEISSREEREVFADALAALASLLGAPRGHPERQTVEVSASDRPALLAAWLEELVYLAERDGFVATALEEFELRDSSLRAVVRGVLGNPPPLVKAVTYHRLTFDRAESGYIATVVLDV